MREKQSIINFLYLANNALRAPLTVVSACLSLLESFTNVESEQRTELISKASLRSKESSLITSDMLKITESFLQTQTQTVRESDLKFIVLEAFEGQDVVLEYPEEEISVLVNEIDFVSALHRIVSSSARWGEVRVVVELIERNVQIRIFDKGPLIEQSEEQLFIAFEPFEDRGDGIYSLSHVYAYVLLQANDATLRYFNFEDQAVTEILMEML